MTGTGAGPAGIEPVCTASDDIPSSQFLWSRFTIRTAIGEPSVFPPTDAGDELCVIRFDLHPSAATVATLPALQVGIDQFLFHGDTGRQALKQANQPFPWDSPEVKNLNLRIVI